jgi:hypothetical protein
VDTIKKHRKKLVAPYNRAAKAGEIIASAKRLAHLIVASDEILERHRKKMLSEVLWLISEADGKYSTRYRSKEVVRLARDEPDSEENIQHEHVYPRKKVVERILDDRAKLRQEPALLDQMLDETVGCVVTATEHRKLLDSLEGWAGYKHVRFSTC